MSYTPEVEEKDDPKKCARCSGSGQLAAADGDALMQTVLLNQQILNNTVMPASGPISAPADCGSSSFDSGSSCCDTGSGGGFDGGSCS